ncbi:hypothetical protein R3P38DRAFT_3236165 [Favolaschia claudopus]|uniref:Ribonuclease H1 N-terminal domain-containing protein n=1 Tax=Favolaschia claudopus TaxID=2862362 RepID=A0AAV9ZDH0_9AGAR
MSAPTATFFNDDGSKKAELSEMIYHLQAIARHTGMAQANLSTLLGGEVVTQAAFVEGEADTPSTVAARYENQIKGSNYWVVLVGRNPGVYPSSKDANAQVLGVPNNSWVKKSGFDAALAHYRDNYPHNVKKLAEEEVGVPQ